MLLHGYDPSDGSFTGTSKFSNPVMEQAQQGDSIIVDDFDFMEAPDLYRTDGVTFTLIGGWQAIKDARNLPPVPTSINVNSERNRRMFSTFTFGGVDYDCEPLSLARITGAATLAGFAMGAGAVAGNLRWHGGADDFTWIAADNSLTTMDAQTCFAFGQTAANNQSAHVFAGAAIKAMDPTPQDFASNEIYWP
jgi:hypothetical protein